MESIIGWILLGALAGWIASLVTGRSKQTGCLGYVITGVIGIFVGDLMMNFIEKGGAVGFNSYSLFVAVLGAVFVHIFLTFIES